jgi:hypothetical protein
MPAPTRPHSNYDGSHLSKDARAAIEKLDPKFKQNILRVADERDQKRERGTGRPAVGTPARNKRK